MFSRMSGVMVSGMLGVLPLGAYAQDVVPAPPPPPELPSPPPPSDLAVPAEPVPPPVEVLPPAPVPSPLPSPSGLTCVGVGDGHVRCYPEANFTRTNMEGSGEVWVLTTEDNFGGVYPLEGVKPGPPLQEGLVCFESQDGAAQDCWTREAMAREIDDLNRSYSRHALMGTGGLFVGAAIGMVGLNPALIPACSPGAVDIVTLLNPETCGPTAVAVRAPILAVGATVLGLSVRQFFVADHLLDQRKLQQRNLDDPRWSVGVQLGESPGVIVAGRF